MHQYPRRTFLQMTLLASAGLLLPRQRTDSATPLSHPQPQTMPCAEEEGRMLAVIATAEALALTCTYTAITTPNGFFTRLRADQQTALRAMLDQDRAHYQALVTQGAVPLATTFYFDPALFGFRGLPAFLETVDTLVHTLIGAYLAGMRRYSELGQPAMVAWMGQLVGIEAEHRVIGREIAQESPPAPNDLCLERATPECIETALAQLGPFLQPSQGAALPITRPSDAQIDAALGGVRCVDIPVAGTNNCTESLETILAIAATAEALGITFYYQGIRGPLFQGLPIAQQWYLQAALDEERVHLAFLAQNGASPGATQFFFPEDAFTSLARFLALLEVLENAFVAAYLAAAQRLSSLGQHRLAAIAGQILGVEAEHRVLGRVMAGAQPPNDLCLHRANFDCLSAAQAALAPFVAGDETFTHLAPLPAANDIAAAVDRFGCTPVPFVDASPFRLYLPVMLR